MGHDRQREGTAAIMAAMRSKRVSPVVTSLCLVLASAACAADAPANPPVGAPAPHHRNGGYQNNYTEFQPKGLDKLLHWKLQALRDGLPAPPSAPTPTVHPDLDFIAGNAHAGAGMQPAVTWIGHASVLVQIGGVNLLTDPVFSERASPLSFLGPKRAQPPGLTLGELPHIDAVLISHNHYDHLDLDSVLALNRQAQGAPLFIVPLGVKAWMRDIGVERVVELDWWQAQRVGEVDVVLTPVQHWSGRTLTDRMATLWGGYALFAADAHVFFSGDTGYSKDFADIRQRFAERQALSAAGGFDLALIAIGGYEPRWFMREQHLNPAEAVQVHLDLNAKRSIGVHWGTFELTDESLDEALRALAAARHKAGLGEADFGVLAIGGTLRLPRRAP
jgi:N-acyl-phosphatidylethanolamine-hydrolysing phospholipase D